MLYNTSLSSVKERGSGALPVISKSIPKTSIQQPGFNHYQPIAHKVKVYPINRSLIKNVQRDNPTILSMKFNILQQNMKRYQTPAPRTERSYSTQHKEVPEYKSKALERYHNSQNQLECKKTVFVMRKNHDRTLTSLLQVNDLKPKNSRSVSVPRLQSDGSPLSTARTGATSYIRAASPSRTQASGFMGVTVSNFHSDQKLSSRINLEPQGSKSDAVARKPTTSDGSPTRIISPLKVPIITYVKESNPGAISSRDNNANSIQQLNDTRQLNHQSTPTQTVTAIKDLVKCDTKEDHDNTRCEKLNELDGYLAKLRDGRIVPTRSSRVRKLKNKPTIFDVFEEKTEVVSTRDRLDSLSKSMSPNHKTKEVKGSVIINSQAEIPMQDSPTKTGQNQIGFTYDNRFSIMSGVSNIDSPDMVREELLKAELLDPAIFDKNLAESEKLAEKIKEGVRKTEPPVHPLLLQINQRRKVYTHGATMGKIISQDQAEHGVKRKWRELLQRFGKAVRLLKKLKLTVLEVLHYKVFSVTPFEKRYSKDFILAARRGEYRQVEYYLRENKYLVYDFDNFHMTALHWAVRHSYVDVIELLISFGADLQAKDIIGRTPLYFAIVNDNLEVLKLLLLNQVEPWSTNEINYNRLMKRKPFSRYYIRRCRQIHILLMMTPARIRDAVWQRESQSLFDSEARKAKRYAYEDDSDDSAGSL